jgi:hypothetical protein
MGNDILQVKCQQRDLRGFYFITVSEDIIQSWSKTSAAIARRMTKLKEVVSQLESKCDVANDKTMDLQRNPCIKMRDHEILTSL